MIISSQKEEENLSITELYDKFSKEYRNIVVVKVLGEVFIFRPLSRLEYKEIINQEELSSVDKEDIICTLCTLYPEKYDFNNCEMAGIPTELAKEIIKNSGVDNIEAYNGIINYYRNEISSDLDAQIACIINEAFPNFDIEEIEGWDIDKTAKYLSRAEFKLTTFRGINESLKEHIDLNHQQEIEYLKKLEEELNSDSDTSNLEEEIKEEIEEETNLKGGKKEKIDIDKLREFQEKFPEFDISQDAVLQEGIEALNVTSDTTPHVFRTGYEDEEM